MGMRLAITMKYNPKYHHDSNHQKATHPYSYGKSGSSIDPVSDRFCSAGKAAHFRNAASALILDSKVRQKFEDLFAQSISVGREDFDIDEMYISICQRT